VTGRARALGWFSVGLGVTQLFAPRSLARACGFDQSAGTPTLMRLLGLRELAAGAGLLSGGRPSTWLWGRFAGDMMDLAILGGALASARGSASPARLGAATLVVAACAAVDGVSAAQAGGPARTDGRRIPRRQVRFSSGRQPQIVIRTITVGRSPDEVYAFWHGYENLPKFMAHLESVITKNGRSRWRAKAPLGSSVEWEAETVIDRPGEKIAWRTVGRSDIAHEGSVEFRPAPSGRGTEVRVELRYQAPGGRAGKLLAKLFGEEPGQQIAGDLRRLKQVLETGEVVHSDASIHRGKHAAWPARDVPAGVKTSPKDDSFAEGRL
jgi:uncharacterized membrane protein